MRELDRDTPPADVLHWLQAGYPAAVWGPALPWLATLDAAASETLIPLLLAVDTHASDGMAECWAVMQARMYAHCAPDWVPVLRALDDHVHNEGVEARCLTCRRADAQPRHSPDPAA
jgi:hypothetical protein